MCVRVSVRLVCQMDHRKMTVSVVKIVHDEVVSRKRFPSLSICNTYTCTVMSCIYHKYTCARAKMYIENYRNKIISHPHHVSLGTCDLCEIDR